MEDCITPRGITMLSNLPTELLQNVLRHVQATASQLSLLHCVLCCKAWRDVALPLLLEHISIRNASFMTMARSLTETNAGAVRHLTLTVEPEKSLIDWMNIREFVTKPAHLNKSKSPHFWMKEMRKDGLRMKEEGSIEARRVWSGLRAIARTLHRMSCLRSLSIIVDCDFTNNREGISWGFFLARSVIAGFLDNLPSTCTALEIDMGCHPRRQPQGPHLCPLLAKVLPQLKILRLRLEQICPHILGPTFNLDGSTDQPPLDPARRNAPLPLVFTPYLETLAVNCVSSWLCGVLPPSYHSFWATNALSTALCSQLQDKSNMPRIRSLYLLGAPATFIPGHFRRSRGLTYVRLEHMTRRVIAMPYRAVKARYGDPTMFLLRSPECPEIIAAQARIEDQAEGNTWSLLSGPPGGRLPTEYIGSGTFPPAQNPRLWTRAQFEQKFPRYGTKLWANERICGMSILQPSIRDGLRDPDVFAYSVREQVSAGWHADEEGILVPD